VRCWLQFAITDDHDLATNGLKGATVRDLLVAFYADNGIIAAPNHQWLQDVLNVLVTLFRKVGLETNVDKTKIMICHPSFIRTHLSDEACKKRLTGEGLSYKDRKQQRVQHQWCLKPFVASYIDSHRATAHHDFECALPALPEALPEDTHVPQFYHISWPRVILHQRRPALDCPFTSLNAGTLAMHRHFQYKHPLDTINLARDGPRPKCTF